MSMIETADFYRAVVESLGFTVRGNRIKITDEDGEEDAEVDGKLLVLPTDEFLRNPKWATEIPFHPLCENPQRGESEVVKMVLESVVGNLNVSLLGVMVHLYTNVAMLPDTKLLTTEQSALLPYVSAVNDKVKKAILSMVTRMTMDDPSTSLLTCNLRRRCPLGGVQYERVCVVRFPMADMDRKETPYGLKTTAEFDTVRGLLDFVVPGWETDDTYSVGTNSFVAPYFLSVMLMYCRVAERLNEVIELYKDVAPALSKYVLPGAARVQELINREGYMEKLRDAIPALDGNRGSHDLNKTANNDYRVEQPKPAVDIPWEEAGKSHEAASADAPIVKDHGDEGRPYVPGQVIKQVVAPATPVGGLTPLSAIAGNGGLNYDPNTFHGRQMAKQALLQPLGQQLANGSASVGQSPFIENTDAQGRSQGATYKPGQLTQVRQQQQQTQQGGLLNPSGLGF